MTNSSISPPGSPSNSPASSVGWFACLTLLTFVSVITAKLIDGEPLRSANDRSRWCTVYSLVDEATYQIDEIRKRSGWDTIDLVRHNDHFYSTKPPLLPRLVAELYRLVKAVTGMNLLDNTAAVTRIILFLINILPMALAMWLMFQLIRRYCNNTFGQIFLITATCWGTLLVPFLTVFNNHTVGTTFVVYSLYLAISIVVEQKESWWRFGLCGFCAAFAVCNELPAAAYGLGLFAVLLKNHPRKTLLCFVPLALIPIAGFFITNYQATGGWKPFYLYYGTEKYRFIHEGKPSYWLSPQGVDQAKDSFSTYLFHCTVGHHGIFSLTPIFLFTLLSWCAPLLWWKGKLRDFLGLGIILSLIVISFYLSKTENYNYGGVSVALRWTLWLTPFWILAMVPFFDRCGKSLLLKVPALIFLCVSLFSAWYPANSPWTQPWLFKVMESRDWIDYSSPRPQFDRKVYTWIGRLPDGPRQEDYWVQLETYGTDGTTETIRLEDGGPTDDDQRLVIVTRDANQQQYKFLRGPFTQGTPPVTCIRHLDGTEISDAEQAFFRGIPKRRVYASSRIRYVDAKIRQDAFKAHIGYSYVDVTTEEGRKFRHQRDVWFTEEVPFGILQFEDRVTNMKSKDIVSRKLWKVREVGKYLPRTSDAMNSADL